MDEDLEDEVIGVEGVDYSSINMPEVIFHTPDVNAKFLELTPDKQKEFAEMVNRSFLLDNGPIIFPELDEQLLESELINEHPGYQALTPEMQEQALSNKIRREKKFLQMQPNGNSAVYKLLVKKLPNINFEDLVDAHDLRDLQRKLNSNSSYLQGPRNNTLKIRPPVEMGQLPRNKPLHGMMKRDVRRSNQVGKMRAKNTRTGVVYVPARDKKVGIQSPYGGSKKKRRKKSKKLRRNTLKKRSKRNKRSTKRR